MRGTVAARSPIDGCFGFEVAVIVAKAGAEALKSALAYGKLPLWPDKGRSFPPAAPNADKEAANDVESLSSPKFSAGKKALPPAELLEDVESLRLW